MRVRGAAPCGAAFLGKYSGFATPWLGAALVACGRMSNLENEFCVLGVGHLAAAVRSRLGDFRLSPDQSCDVVNGTRVVLIACSDYENASSFEDVRHRAMEQGASALFACITRGHVRVGHFVSRASECAKCSHLPRSWDFSLSHRGDRVVADSTTSTSIATATYDAEVKWVAQLGAMAVVCEIWRLLAGVAESRLVERVTEIDPPLAGVGGGWRQGALGCLRCGEQFGRAALQADERSCRRLSPAEEAEPVPMGPGIAS